MTERRAKHNLFSDAQSITRSDDILQVEYATGDVAKRIWREHLRPRLGLVIVSSIAMAITAATTGAVPFLIQMTADEVFVNKNANMVLPITAAVIAVTFIKAIAEYISNVAVGFLGHRFIADLRVAMFAKISYADMSWIQSVHSGRLLSGFLYDANLIRQAASKAIVALVENVLKVVVLMGVMLWMDLRFSGAILVLMPIGVVLLGRQRRRMRKSTTKSLQETGDLSALITQTLRGMRVVRAYQQERMEISRAADTINRSLEFTMRGARARAASAPAMEILVGIGFAAAIYWAGVKGVTGAVSLGHFMGFMASAVLLYQPLKSVATLQTSLQEGVAAASRVFGIIDHKRHLTEKPDAKPLKLSKGELNFENVTFSYEPGNPVLRDITLKVPAGKTVALVGRSGSGKSTLMNLALRFYDPVEGRVTIDGQNIRDVTFPSLRDSIALVTQDPVLFDDTLSSNISYGSKAGGERAVRAAAKAAAADSFISKLPDGYETRAGEAGNALSGGEKQRVAIARAIFKDAPILLLDEPTSSLDSEAEDKVQRALDKLMRGRTVIVIAHRLSTIKKADIIYVLDAGRIVETGRHTDLVAAGGLYARLHRTQLGAVEDDTPPTKRARSKVPAAAAGE
jgi:subfamily B ATP-binding cassette protein MsbA